MPPYGYQNSWFPATYQPAVPQYPVNTPQPQPQIQPQPQTQQSANGPILVRGEAVASGYPCNPGCSVILFDENASVFYIKSVDASGMPNRLRVFEYTERLPEANTQPAAHEAATPEFVTRDEFERRIAEITNSRNNKYTNNQNGGKEKVNG